jgi:hypothetical protein
MRGRTGGRASEAGKERRASGATPPRMTGRGGRGLNLQAPREAPGFDACGDGEAMAARASVFERGELYPAGRAAGAKGRKT